MAELIPQTIINQPDKVDMVSESVFYQGWAAFGAPAENAAKWGIIKRVKVGNVWSKLFAEGSANKTFKWSDRASYNYTTLK